jgi:serine/threonine protein kinase
MGGLFKIPKRSKARLEPLDIQPVKAKTLTQPPTQPAPPSSDAMAGPPDRSPGDMLGPAYQVLSVHRGGMGLVYIVQDLESLKRGRSFRLALKTFQARYLWDEPALSRFEREALQWINLSPHQNIVRALLVQRIEGRPYIWLEVVDGGSLSDRLARGALPVNEAIDIALQFIMGMRHAHEKHGLIHRDIKPANTLLTKNNVVKISDFGLSKLRAEILSEIDGIRPEISPFLRKSETAVMPTAPGIVVGTPAYIPPEAILDPLSADCRGDIYSFGIMFFEMLTGRPMFMGPDVLSQHVLSSPSPPSSINSAVPVQLDAVVLRCVEKLPRNRYQNFAELESAILMAASSLKDWKARLSPAQPIIPPKQDLFMKAFTLMEFGRREEAIRAFKEVLALDPQEAEAHNNIGVCLAEQGHFAEAVEYCLKAVSIRPGYAEAWANLGGFYEHLKQYPEGLNASDRAIVLKPEWAEAHSNRGANLIGLGRLTEAVASIEKALKIDPGYWKAYVRMAVALFYSGAGPRSVLDCIEKALAIQPRDATAHAIASSCSLDLGNLDSAKKHLAIAVDLSPDDPFVNRVEVIISRKLSSLKEV